MQEFTYVIKDSNGIHARPAGELVNQAKKFESQITIQKDDKSADLKRILAVMSMAVKCGDRVVIQADGTDEETAINELQEFFKSKL